MAPERFPNQDIQDYYQKPPEIPNQRIDEKRQEKLERLKNSSDKELALEFVKYCRPRIIPEKNNLQAKMIGVIEDSLEPDKAEVSIKESTRDLIIEFLTLERLKEDKEPGLVQRWEDLHSKTRQEVDLKEAERKAKRERVKFKPQDQPIFQESLELLRKKEISPEEFSRRLKEDLEPIVQKEIEKENANVTYSLDDYILQSLNHFVFLEINANNESISSEERGKFRKKLQEDAKKSKDT